MYVIILVLLFSAVFPRASSAGIWEWSVAASVAANTADVHSAWGHFQDNPIFRGSNGRLDKRRGIVLKAAFVGGLTLTQWLILRKHPKLRKPFALINFVAAGGMSGATVRNYVQRYQSGKQWFLSCALNDSTGCISTSDVSSTTIPLLEPVLMVE